MGSSWTALARTASRINTRAWWHYMTRVLVRESYGMYGRCGHEYSQGKRSMWVLVFQIPRYPESSKKRTGSGKKRNQLDSPIIIFLGGTLDGASHHQGKKTNKSASLQLCARVTRRRASSINSKECLLLARLIQSRNFRAFRHLSRARVQPAFDYRGLRAPCRSARSTTVCASLVGP